jgi:esterase/lipase superfamily enzyme
MKREYHRWHSPSLRRDMELLVFGYAGARILAFPTSMGRFYDWEDRGLVGGVLRHGLENGYIQLTCVDSVDAESWYSPRPPAERVERHVQYDRYLFDEVLPLTRSLNANPFLIVTGASFGGYHAVNFALKHPEQVGRLLSMSGLCDIRRLIPDYSDQQLYFNNPVDFMAGEQDPGRLDALRRMDIILAVGRADSLCASNERLSQILWSKNIWNALRVWNGFAHDWPVWERMLQLYLSGHD